MNTKTFAPLVPHYSRSRRPRKSAQRPPRMEALEARRLLAADLSFAFSDALETETTEGPAEYATLSFPPSTYQEAGLMIDHGNAANGLPLLSSNPSAAAKIYLDFDGHFEPQWGSYSNITTPAWSLDSDLTTFNSTEAAGIRAIWQRVAEDFAPFNVDVTTIEPASFANREGLRVAIGGNSSWLGQTYTGVAYVNTWTNSIVNTVYVFPAHLSNNIKYIAEVASHEVGHAFGLRHQSTYDSDGNLVREYSTGSGNWAPIMGNGLTKTRTTWHLGPSTSATTIQDDLAVITRTFNGFGYREDDHGGLDKPTPLTIGDNGNTQVVGVIERNDDVDAFSFEVTTDSLGDFRVDVFDVGPNLRARMQLWTDDGELLVTANPDSTFGASFTYQLDPGHYTLAVLNDGSYGSLGHYTVTINLSDLADPPPPDTQPGQEIILDSELGIGITINGDWEASSSQSGFVGSNYLHDQNAEKGTKSVTFRPSIPEVGEYEVYAIWASHSNRANNVPIDIVHATGTTTVTVNQRTNGGKWNLLGTFPFDAGSSGEVRIRTTDTNGFVIADAIRLVPLHPVSDTVAPTVELTEPVHGDSVEADELNTRGYLTFTFDDVGSGIDPSSITDSDAAITLVGSAAENVVLASSPIFVGGTTYQYPFDGVFKPGTVEVHFPANSFFDLAGNGNLQTVQTFTVIGTVDTIEDPEEDSLVAEPILIDSENGEGVTIVGNWPASNSVSGYIGNNYLHDDNHSKGTKSVTFTPTIVKSGAYEVFTIWTSHSNRANNVPIDIQHANGTETLYVNQQTAGRQWNLLGTFSFEAGNNGFVQFRTTDTNGFVIVDAVRFVPVQSAAPPTATLVAPLPNTSIDVDLLNERAYIDVQFEAVDSGIDSASVLDSQPEFTLVGSAASDVVVTGVPTLIADNTYRYSFSGTFSPGEVEVHFPTDAFRNLEGTGNIAFTLSFAVAAPPENLIEAEEILVDNDDSTGVSIVGVWDTSRSQSGFVGKDYLHDLNSSKGTKSVTFQPTVEVAGKYEVYTIWTSHSNRATNVPVDIVHAAGSTTVTVNQRVNGRQWNLLGTFDFTEGTNGLVRFRTDDTNGFVIVDAVRFVPVFSPSAGPASSSGEGDIGGQFEIPQAEWPWQEDGARPFVSSTILSNFLTTDVIPTQPVFTSENQLVPAPAREGTAREWYFAGQGRRAGHAGNVDQLPDDLLDILVRKR